MKTVGELVVYGASGVCRIEDVREENFSGSARCYYILRPITEQGNDRIFIPVDNAQLVSGMKAVLQPQEVLTLVRETQPFAASEWPADGRSRSKLSRDILAAGDRLRMVQLIKTIYGRAKAPSSTEEAICHRAAAMLYQEFSLVLELGKADVIPFVMGEYVPSIKGV